ncbi:helix-turn-helix domain-containing protein [Bacteroides sedimenti]|uniref:Transcriptional regulator n=1 Tax=Bacteroides sedimenti TaxID=2136147 RepID=A0ABN6ZAZ8_9BACE
MNKSTHTKEYNLLLQLLYSLRLNAGFTQLELAKRMNVPQSYISKIENGERRIDIIELRSICHALNCDMVDFVKELQNRINESK